jgi:hypothetical protein
MFPSQYELEAGAIQAQRRRDIEHIRRSRLATERAPAEATGWSSLVWRWLSLPLAVAVAVALASLEARLASEEDAILWHDEWPGLSW